MRYCKIHCACALQGCTTKTKGIKHEWLRSEKLLSSKKRKHFDGVWCNWDFDIFEIVVIFYNKEKQEIKRVKVAEMQPHLVELPGKMAWDEGDESVSVFSKDGRTQWVSKLK